MRVTRRTLKDIAIDPLLSEGDFILGSDIDKLEVTRNYNLRSLRRFIENYIYDLQPEIDASLMDEGTREGGDLIAIIGDYDNSSNSTTITINDSEETIAFKADGYVRANSKSLQVGDTSHSFFGNINSASITSDRIIQLPDESGYTLMSINSIPTDSLGNIDIPVAPQASEDISGRVELATVEEVNEGTDTLRVITPEGLEGSGIKTKIDTIETGATATTNANVNAAGATMNADTSLVGNSYFLDQDTLSTNDRGRLASQQSIKAYADNAMPPIPAASDAVAGLVELATIEEINEGTDTERAVTAGSLGGSAIQTKIDTIEQNADITDLTNVFLSGATMGFSFSLFANDYFLDEDDMASDDATKVASQQSIKAYVDNSTGVSVPNASDTVSGLVELATVAEVNTGTDTVKAITPASLEGSSIKTKLDTIETGANVTDGDNVDAAGATINTDTSLSGNSYFLDEDDFASDDATKVASQQSIKTYVDASNTPPAATNTNRGLVELATISEIDGGTDTTRAITPAGLEGSAIKTKLDTIETGANVTDSFNVLFAGASMTFSASLINANYFLDEDDFSSDDATKVASQQSIKAYVDDASPDIPEATETTAGVVELATIAEVNTGTDTTRAVTPAGLAGSGIQTKIDTVETNADVTDTANVNSAGATLNTDTSLSGNSYFLNENDLSSNDATKVASQFSIKTYADDANEDRGKVLATTSISADYTVSSDDFYILGDTTSNSLSVTIPSGAVSQAGRALKIIRGTGNNLMTTTTEDGELIRGQTSISNIRRLNIVSDGTNWQLI